MITVSILVSVCRSFPGPLAQVIAILNHLLCLLLFISLLSSSSGDDDGDGSQDNLLFYQLLRYHSFTVPCTNLLFSLKQNLSTKIKYASSSTSTSSPSVDDRKYGDDDGGDTADNFVFAMILSLSTVTDHFFQVGVLLRRNTKQHINFGSK